MRKLATALLALCAPLFAQTHVGDGIWIDAVDKSAQEVFNTGARWDLFYKRWSTASRKSRWVVEMTAPDPKKTLAVLFCSPGVTGNSLTTPFFWGAIPPTGNSDYSVPLNWNFKQTITLPKMGPVFFRFWWVNLDSLHWGVQRSRIISMEVR